MRFVCRHPNLTGDSAANSSVKTPPTSSKNITCIASVRMPTHTHTAPRSSRLEKLSPLLALYYITQDVRSLGHRCRLCNLRFNCLRCCYGSRSLLPRSRLPDRSSHCFSERVSFCIRCTVDYKSAANSFDRVRSFYNLICSSLVMSQRADASSSDRSYTCLALSHLFVAVRTCARGDSSNDAHR